MLSWRRRPVATALWKESREITPGRSMRIQFAVVNDSIRLTSLVTIASAHRWMSSSVLDRPLESPPYVRYPSLISFPLSHGSLTRKPSACTWFALRRFWTCRRCTALLEFDAAKRPRTGEHTATRWHPRKTPCGPPAPVPRAARALQTARGRARPPAAEL